MKTMSPIYGNTNCKSIKKWKKNSEKSNETKKEEFIKKMKTYCKEISLIVNAIKRPKTIWLLCFSLLC